MSTTLLALAIRSTLILAFGGAVTLAMRKASAAFRNAVWRMALLGILILPVMLVRPPTWDIPLARVPIVERAAEYAQPTFFPATTRTVDRMPVVAAEPQPPSTPENKTIDWTILVVAVWSALATAALIPLIVGLAVLNRTIHRSTPIGGPEFSALCAALGIRRRVELRASDTIQTPAAAGVLRPVVLIPESAKNWDKDRLEMVLRHELGHIQRGDWIVRVMAHVACSLYAPNPLVWFASTRLRAESEAACDDLVVAGGVNAKAYAQELLAIAHGVKRSSLALATVGMAHRPNVESRLRAIVDPRRRRRSLSRKALTALTICGLLGAGLIATVRLVKAQGPPLLGSVLASNPGQNDFMKGVRDDVSDHPTIPAIHPGAKFTVEPYAPPASHVTVAQNGVAHLPNGVTVSLNGIAPTATNDPIWNLANQNIQHVRIEANRAFGDYGEYVPGIDRSLYCAITSQIPAIASTMGYLYKPQSPESAEIKGVRYGAYGRDIKSNHFVLGSDSLHTIQLMIPGPPKIDRCTYRVGVAVGEWKTVMDVPNPYHGVPNPATAKLKNNGGGVTMGGIPCIIGPKSPGVKGQPNDRFVGIVNSSELVARRALVLDEKGDLIRGERTFGVDWYPLSYEDICRCTHVVIQEREMDWAEFRDIPLRPTLERDAKKAAGTLIEGTAKGIAPGFEKKIPGIGSVAISAVLTARAQGGSWTDDGQPRWRADGMVLAEPSRSSGPGAYQSGPRSRASAQPNPSDPPTIIRLQYAGSPWHKVNSRLRVEGEPAENLPLPVDVPYQLVRVLDKKVKQVNILLDIADGPWKALDTKPIDVPALPDVASNTRTDLSTGLVLFDNERPWMIVLKQPTDMRTASNPPKEMFKMAPKDMAHRFVAVMRDGSEVQLPAGPNVTIPARHGENPSLESFNRIVGRRTLFTGDIKEIRYEYRPITRTVQFDHVAVKPKL